MNKWRLLTLLLGCVRQKNKKRSDLLVAWFFEKEGLALSVEGEKKKIRIDFQLLHRARLELFSRVDFQSILEPFSRGGGMKDGRRITREQSLKVVRIDHC